VDGEITMARDTKTKGKGAMNGHKPKLDAKLAKLVAKRTKKLRQQLAEATRLERKRVRALDKAHRRRQLIEAALSELQSGKPMPALPAVSEPVPAVKVAVMDPAPAEPPVAAAPKPAAAKRAPVRRTRPAPAPKA
jgi:hypothetical protein